MRKRFYSFLGIVPECLRSKDLGAATNSPSSNIVGDFEDRGRHDDALHIRSENLFAVGNVPRGAAAPYKASRSQFNRTSCAG